MALDQSTKPIPGIPLSALDAVGDANVRDVLRALVATHNVRNNLAGSGNEAFITTRQALQAVRAAEVTDTASAPRLLARFTQGTGGTVYGPGTLSGALGAVHLSLDRPAVFQTLLTWTAAGIADSRTRVELHNGPGTVLLSQSDTVRGGYVRSHAASTGFLLEPGDYTLTVHAGNDGSGSYALGGWSLLLLPVLA